MVALDSPVVTTALPAIQRDLGATLTFLQWAVNAYTLPVAVLLLAPAGLGDRFGRRRLFCTGLAVFTSASAAAALAETTGALIAARAVQGAGGAIGAPLTLTILSEAVPRGRRGLALGAWGAVSGLAIAIGPLIGGAIVEGMSWQWIFLLNVPIGVALLPLAAIRLRESTGPDAELDLVGLARAGAAMGFVVFGLVRASDADLGHDPGRSPHRDGSLAARGVHRLGDEGSGTHDPDGLVLFAYVRSRQRDILADVPRHVRVDLPPRAVPARSARLLPLRSGHPDPALGRRHGDHRPLAGTCRTASVLGRSSPRAWGC